MGDTKCRTCGADLDTGGLCSNWLAHPRRVDASPSWHKCETHQIMYGAISCPMCNEDRSGLPLPNPAPSREQVEALPKHYVHRSSPLGMFKWTDTFVPLDAVLALFGPNGAPQP